MQKQKHNKYYKGRLTKREKDIRVKKTLSFILTLVIVFTGYWNWAMYQPEYTNAEVNVPVKIKDNRTTRQIVMDYLESRNVSENFISRFECLMYFENRSWNEKAVGVNRNGSYDRGLLQWNSRTAPIKIDNECAFDALCSTNEFINYINKGGSWNRWLGYKNNCQ